MEYYYSGSSFIVYARDQAVALGGLSGNPLNPQDDAYDAFRHALLSAKLTDHLGSDIAKAIGDTHEQEGTARGDDPRSTNMDLYNNDVGREEYVNWRNARNGGSTKSLEEWIYDAVKAGKTINDFTDSRKWIDHPPSNQIPPSQSFPKPLIDPSLLDPKTLLPKIPQSGVNEPYRTSITPRPNPPKLSLIEVDQQFF